MSSPELWVGRIRRDAYDARRHGCTGLIGIHWRTEEVGPMVAALSQAQWSVPQAAVTAPRNLPADDFYLDWARHQFGEAAAREVAGIFVRIDGHLPTPAPNCPGGIAVDRAPWSKVQRQYAFVDELAALRPRVHGAGNQARFDHWVKSFQYLRAIGRVACTRGELDRAMAELNKLTDPGAQRAFARDNVLPVRVRLKEDWGRMMTLCLETADTWGSIGHVFTHEMFNRGTMGLLEGHDQAIQKALGTDLPDTTRASKAYAGRPRLIVPSRRSVAEAGEELTLKVIVLDNSPPKSAVLRWRPIGLGAWQFIPLKRVARAVHTVTLPPALNDTLEYYFEAETADGTLLRWPATAPELNHTVVVMPK
jgi:RNase P/RNase MRP subunit POP5